MNELSPQGKVAMDLLNQGEESISLFFRNATGLDIFYPLREAGWFSPEQNPAPYRDEKQGLYIIPHWPVLDYLERVAKESALPENQHYAEALMLILREVTWPTSGERVDNFRTWDSFSRIISALPSDVIKIQDIDLIDDWLNTQFPDISLVGYEVSEKLLPKLLKSDNQREIELAIRVVDVVSRIKWVDKKVANNKIRKETITPIDPYWLNRIFQSNAQVIGYKCGLTALNMLRSNLREVNSKNNSDQLSYIWCPAIEDNQQRRIAMDIKSILLFALRDALLGYAEKNSLEAKDYLRQMFDDGSQVALRLAIYATDRRFDLFKEVFQEAFKPSLLDIRLLHELHSLLAHHFNELTPENKTQIIEAIEGLSEIWIQDRQVTAISNAHLRLRWLSALKETKNARVHELYRKYMAITEPELIDLPPDN
jgi:hypothetical protein